MMKSGGRSIRAAAKNIEELTVHHNDRFSGLLTFDSRDYLYSMKTAGGDLQVMIAKPVQSVNSQITLITQNTGKLLIISMLLIAAALYLVISYIYKPIREMSREAAQDHDGEEPNEFMIIYRKLQK